MDSNRLSTKDHWNKVWQNQGVKVRFNPYLPSFADFHNLFRRNLPSGENLTFLEIGAYPGKYLWYFNKYFGYQVSGLEYVEELCQPMKKKLQDIAGINANIINADFFNYSSDISHPLWDIVASFGFIEHFKDTQDVIKKHLSLVKTGGYLILTIPNHNKIYSEILKIISYEKYVIHNLMTYQDILHSLEGIDDIEIMEGGYYGKLGFGHTDLYTYMKYKFKYVYFILRSPFFVMEMISRLLPNSSIASPYIGVVIRKL